jgi:hypothetical protein
MNKKQMRFLWAGIIIICLMGLYPPWSQEVDVFNKKISEYANYSWIFLPPSFDISSHDLEITEETQKTAVYFVSEIVKEYSVHINTTILFIQWICVALLTFGFIVTFRDKK